MPGHKDPLESLFCTESISSTWGLERQSYVRVYMKKTIEMFYCAEHVLVRMASFRKKKKDIYQTCGNPALGYQKDSMNEEWSMKDLKTRGTNSMSTKWQIHKLLYASGLKDIIIKDKCPPCSFCPNCHHHLPSPRPKRKKGGGEGGKRQKGRWRKKKEQPAE